ncbi:hypothetical protein ACHGLA_11735 [Streptomyces sp. YH02]
MGQSCDGDGQASASRTVNAPATRVTEAFVDEEFRRARPADLKTLLESTG